jgi:hypothetical protein
LVLVTTQADGALCDLPLWSCCKETLEVVHGLETHHAGVVNGY